MRAVAAGNKPFALWLLDHGLDARLRDRSGQTALNHLEAWDGEVYRSIALALLEHGSPVDGRHGVNHETPLMVAAIEGDPAVVKALVEHGARLEDRDRLGQTALLAARRWFYARIVHVLIDAGANVHAKDADGANLLMHATANGSPEVVKLLLDRGFDVNARDRNGQTALFYLDAETPDAGATLALLKERGGYVDVRDRRGRTPLLATANQPGNVQHIVLRAWPLLLGAGADVKARDRNGDSALTLLASHKPPASELKGMIAAGADVYVRNRQGISALTFALRYGDDESATALREHGATVELPEALLLRDHELALSLARTERNHNRRGPLGQTALMYAAERGYEDIVRMLLDRGADSNLHDDHGMTALHTALAASPYGLPPYRRDPISEDERARRTDIIRLLLDRGADPNAGYKRRDFGDLFLSGGPRETALQWAAAWNWPDVVQLLLDSGADATGHAGQAALDYALETGHSDIAALLSGAGARELPRRLPSPAVHPDVAR